jgi:hypothetical protein
MRRGFGILGLVVTLLVIATVGFIAYQFGYSEGYAQHAPAATGGGTAVAPYPYYYGFYGPHFFGFGWIIGLLFFLFLAFVFFRIVAFGLFGGWRRGWGSRGGWGRHYGGGVPPAIDERMREWHRQAHGDAPATPPPPPPPPPGSGQVAS